MVPVFKGFSLKTNLLQANWKNVFNNIFSHLCMVFIKQIDCDSELYFMFLKHLYTKVKQESQAETTFFCQLNDELSLSRYIKSEQVELLRIKPKRLIYNHLFEVFFRYLFLRHYFLTNLVFQVFFHYYDQGKQCLICFNFKQKSMDIIDRIKRKRREHYVYEYFSDILVKLHTIFICLKKN